MPVGLWFDVFVAEVSFVVAVVICTALISVVAFLDVVVDVVSITGVFCVVDIVGVAVVRPTV